jgi:hypothetical protein
MRQLSPTGKQMINDLAQRHGFSSDAVFGMLQSVINGHGSMAQFSHPEFGDSGQWMRGGSFGPQCIILGAMGQQRSHNPRPQGSGFLRPAH